MTDKEEKLSQELNSGESEQEKANREMGKYFQNMNNQFKLMSGISVMGILKGVKGLATGTVEQTKIRGINSIIYFLTLSGILNVVYFAIFDVLEAYSYIGICMVAPIVLTIFMSGGNSIGRFLQRFSFNDKDITIIFISSLIVFLITLFV